MFKVEKLSHSYGSQKILDNINFTVNKNSIISIVGPSGCGKTTLLKILAKIISSKEGQLYGFDDLGGYVFQEPRLLPWCTVAENIKFVLKDKYDILEIDSIIKKTLDLVELSEFANYYPLKLSGGMQQRVAIARALSISPTVMFLDEPFQSLDYQLKQRLMKEFLILLSNNNYTVFLVTHDIRVAATMGDRVLVLGKSPSTLVKDLLNPIDRSERILMNKSMMSFENQIYDALSKNV